MNTADRSLSMGDYALRRRFAFVELEPYFHSPVFAEHMVDAGVSKELVTEIRQRTKLLNQAIIEDESNLGRGQQIGHSILVPEEGQEANADWPEQILRFEIKPPIEEYYCVDPSKRLAALEATLGSL